MGHWYQDQMKICGPLISNKLGCPTLIKKHVKRLEKSNLPIGHSRMMSSPCERSLLATRHRPTIGLRWTMKGVSRASIFSVRICTTTVLFYSSALHYHSIDYAILYNCTWMRFSRPRDGAIILYEDQDEMRRELACKLIFEFICSTTGTTSQLARKKFSSFQS